MNNVVKGGQFLEFDINAGSLIEKGAYLKFRLRGEGLSDREGA